MLVAQIAYNHLDPAVKAKCDALIGVPRTYSSTGTSNFVTASAGRTIPRANWEPAAGIILIYRSVSMARRRTRLRNLQRGPRHQLRITNLLSTAVSLSNQAVCLRYLLHFVGDIEQPLHCSTAFFRRSTNGDAGGNGFYISGTWNNLHSLWDSGGGYLTDSAFRPLSSAAKTPSTRKSLP